MSNQVDPIVYTDDPDAHATFTVKDRQPDGDLDWEPLVGVGAGDYTITAEWLGDPGTPRDLKVPLTGIESGTKRLYLKVPDDNDIKLGTVIIRSRS